MSYNREELFNLPVEEKLELVEALWDKIDEDLMPVTNAEIEFAKARLRLHEENPSDGLAWEELKRKIQEKYGF